MRKVLYLFALLLAFVSCKEQDDTIEEFPNWYATNDAYFSQLVAETQAKIADGDNSVALLQGYSVPTVEHSNQYYDYVVAEKLESGAGTVSPMLTDTVEVHYVGQLIPSNYLYRTYGMEFDRSYSGDYDPMKPTAKFAVNSLVTGFATALLYMHKGDHWRIYIPYQLGYGTSASGYIPAGSTLIFDLRLADFWRKTKGDRK